MRNEFTRGFEFWRIALGLDPVPAARPRVGKFGTYYPKTYSRWKLRADELLQEHARGVTPTNELLYVHLDLIAEKPKTSKLLVPSSDIDNYVKAVFDAVTKSQLIWSDDRQIAAMHAQKRFAEDGEMPGFVLTAGLTAGAVWEAVAGLLDGGELPSDIMDVYDRVELV